MPGTTYHHGNLRVELLAAARTTVRERGVDAVSLRELARETGVSKTAPSRHFPDKRSLLRVLAADGFEQLRDELDRAVTDAGAGYLTQLRAVAAAFVEFAVQDAALLDLMFQVAKSADAGDVDVAANRVYAVIWELVQHGQDSGELLAIDPTRLQLLMTATFQGIASLASSGRLGHSEQSALIDDAIDLFRPRNTPAQREFGSSHY